MLLLRRRAIVTVAFTCAIMLAGLRSLYAVTLTASDAAGQTSFASGLHWSDALAPSAGKAYVVDTARTLRNAADSTGTVTFAGDSLTLGSSSSSAGVLIFKNLSGATVNVNNLTLNNGEVQAGGTSAGAGNSTTLGGSITLGANAGRFNSGAADRSIIVSAPITGGGNVSFTSAGFTRFTNPANNYTGSSTISAGMFRAADGSSLPTASNLIINGGIFGTETDFTRSFGTGSGQVQLGTGVAGFAAFGATRNVNLNSLAPLTWGTAPFNISTLILSHSSSDATVVLQNPINLGATTRTIQVDNGSATIDAEISGALSSTGGGLTKTGAGTLTLSATNSYTGLTSIGTNAGGGRIGVIRAKANQALGTGNVTIGPGGNDATARLELEGGISLGNPTIDLDGRPTAIVGIQNISGNNTMTGNIRLNSGGAAYGIQSDANTLTLSGGISTTATGARTLTITGAGNGEVSGIISNGAGTVNIAKTGTGTWKLSGANTYAGTTQISGGGILSVASINSVVGGSASSNMGAPITEINGRIALGGSGASGTLLYTGAGETTDREIDLSGGTGDPSGVGIVDQSGTGLLKFTSAMQTTSGDVQKTLTLQGSTAGTGEFAGAIADRAPTFKTSVVKNGTGQWTISGSNSYTGTTTVNDGTLLVNGSNTGAGAVTVNAGTLGGTGSIAGAVTVNNGATLSPGSSIESLGTGTLTFNATAASASHLKFEIAANGNGDLVNAAGGALNIADSTAAGSAAGTLLDIDSGGAYIPTGNKYTVAIYNGSWNSNKFKNDVGGYVYLGGPNPRQFLIKYNDQNFGSNFSLESQTAKNASAATRFVTLVAVPELGSFTTMGLVACCVLVAVRIGRRFGHDIKI